MNRYPKIVFLYHSGLLSLNVVGPLLYRLQFFLYKLGVLNKLFLSRKVFTAREELVDNVSENSDVVVFKTHLFAGIAKRVKCQKILDLPYFEPEKEDKGKVFILMWTLVHMDYVSPKNNIYLKKILPSNYPVKDPSL